MKGSDNSPKFILHYKIEDKSFTNGMFGSIYNGVDDVSKNEVAVKKVKHRSKAWPEIRIPCRVRS